VPNDVYLNYSIYILTSSMRVVSFSLNMRSGLPSKDDHKSSVPVDRLLKPVETPAYTSLLGTETWKPPATLSSGLPATPRLDTPGGSKDFRVTPDTLRFFSRKVDEIVTGIHGVESAFRQANARVDLQHEELDRQVTKVNEIRVLLGELRGARQDRIESRTHAIQAGQQALIARLDRVLTELMNRANPTLSDHETKWFEELGRIREQVLGAGRYDEASLKARVQAVRHDCSFSGCAFCTHDDDDSKAETGVRSAATSPEGVEREAARRGKEYARKEFGPWCITGVRVWSTI
jgi:nucleoporin NUP82